MTQGDPIMNHLFDTHLERIQDVCMAFDVQPFPTETK